MRARGHGTGYRCLPIALSIAGAVCIAAHQPAERASLDVLLTRAAWYLDYFVDQFENVVRRGGVHPDSSILLQSSAPASAVVAVSSPSARRPTSHARGIAICDPISSSSSRRTRRPRPFRDVLEVDGVAVRDREQRLASPSSPGARCDGASQRIRQEALATTSEHAEHARQSNARARRLQLTYQPRFHFSLGKEDKSVGAGVWTVDSKKKRHPR